MTKKKRERQLDAELQFHLDRQIADNLRAGMPPDEARRNARLKFGGPEQLKEDCRDVRRTRWIENIIQDVRFALRMLRRSPGFSLVAVLCLALGIGANAAIFSVMDALMLRLLPVEHPEQLMLFGEGQSVGVNDDIPRNAPDLFSRPFYQDSAAGSRCRKTMTAISKSSASSRTPNMKVFAKIAAAPFSSSTLKVKIWTVPTISSCVPAASRKPSLMKSEPPYT
jgi:hypothetical protein